MRRISELVNVHPLVFLFSLLLLHQYGIWHGLSFLLTKLPFTTTLHWHDNTTSINTQQLAGTAFSTWIHLYKRYTQNNTIYYVICLFNMAGTHTHTHTHSHTHTLTHTVTHSVAEAHTPLFLERSVSEPLTHVLHTESYSRTGETMYRDLIHKILHLLAHCISQLLPWQCS